MLIFKLHDYHMTIVPPSPSGNNSVILTVDSCHISLEASQMLQILDQFKQAYCNKCSELMYSFIYRKEVIQVSTLNNDIKVQYLNDKGTHFLSQHKKSLRGQLFILWTIFQISAVKFSNQKGGPPLPLPLELPHLPLYMVCDGDTG